MEYKIIEHKEWNVFNQLVCTKYSIKYRTKFLGLIPYWKTYKEIQYDWWESYYLTKYFVLEEDANYFAKKYVCKLNKSKSTKTVKYHHKCEC
jgi:hypothetical protein